MKILLIVAVVLLSTFNPAAAGQTLKEIMTPPADSADSENLRIWVPVERRSKCRLIIDILDSENQVIRHLVDILAGPGYHNFYWDKKNDSGTFVDSGTYRYRIDDCGNKKRGQVKVAYTGIRIEIQSALGLFAQEIHRKSTSLRVEWLSVTDSLLSTVLDTTLIDGHYKISLPDYIREHPDDYIQLIRIDGKVVERIRSRTKEQK
ncbi:MAG: hypothetical protein IID63_08840 [candidate division Zixibacteria bacterium]|nr:hypothetical protein [candidate division Zixibacteria bacterium]